jgi:dipeptidyl aminopeptidase/acylaminoacyl peptidase
MPADGGEAREVTRHRAGVGELAWSADGTRLAYVTTFDPENPEEVEPEPSAPPRVRVTRRIDYKQDNRGYLHDTRTQVFVVDVESGERRRVTKEARDYNHPQWSPDGRWLACQTTALNGMVSQGALLEVDGEGCRPIGPELGVFSTWAWSPDGRSILYAGDCEQTWQTDFFLYDVASGESKRLTDDLFCLPFGGFPTLLPPSQPVWLDGRRALFHGIHRGASGLYEIDTETGAVETIHETGGLATTMSADEGRRYFALATSSLADFGEVTVLDRESGESSVITSLSKPILEGSPAAQWEAFSVSRGGYTTEAWLLKPADFDESKRYPAVLDVHGGPNGYYGYGFNAIQQALATNGFLVVYSNPRGSSSYGREFTQQVTRDWGGEDFLDLMAVVDEVVQRPYADPARLGIWGYSYGGYMTAWALGRTDRFKAAVCGAPCFDLESMWGTSDIGHSFGEMQWGGNPYAEKEWYATHSPHTYASKIRTPTLIIHGEADDRCPIGQGEQMFVTLKKHGCEVEFARYPGGSHLFISSGAPEHRVDAIQRILSWFQGHL